jgi:imidazolonepropionase-like amidohydrolase
VLNSRYLLFEAQQAHYYSLPPHLALASVTSVPASAAGLAHRIGILRDGADADVVLWDSHPLHLGATPLQVWIDGIQQIPSPSKAAGQEAYVAVEQTKEDPKRRDLPEVPNWDEERKMAVQCEGLPPLEGQRESGKVVFHNVKEVWTRETDGTIEESFNASSDPGDGDTELGMVVVDEGRIICVGSAAACLPTSALHTYTSVDLHGGSISPGFMSFGSPLGLEEISGEPSTGNGYVHDAFVTNVPSILGDTGGVTRAIDALMFHTRNALYASSTLCSTL